MRKLLLSSIVMLIFSASLFLFQVSCQKEAQAQTTKAGANKIVYANSNEIWIADIDGKNQKKVNVTIPSTNEEGIIDIKLSPDGSKIIFLVNYETEPDYIDYGDIYSCNIDGSNLIKLISSNDKDGNDKVIYSLDVF